MKLTAPVYVLKGKEKQLKRTQSITMTEALNQVAHSEGFSSWSLLQSKIQSGTPKTLEDLLNYLNPGDLLLVGARPGLGKTILALRLLLLAQQAGRQCFFFSFEYTHSKLRSTLTGLDKSYNPNSSLLSLELSDEISSDYIIKQTKNTEASEPIIVIDYLQLLDQSRSKPPLQKQVEDLKSYAKNKKCSIIFLSQIDRSYEETKRRVPDLGDLRLPNPLDLNLFNKSIFIQDGNIYIPDLTL